MDIDDILRNIKIISIEKTLLPLVHQVRLINRVRLKRIIYNDGTQINL